MLISNYPKLQNILKSDEKIVYLCGAGVSIAFDNRSKNWWNWLQSGRGFLSESDRLFFDELIDKGDTIALTEAAEFLLYTLKTSGKYKIFMDDSFSVLEPLDESLKKSFIRIARMGDYIATTNYDSILEKAVGSGSVTYSSPDEMLHVMQCKSKNKILHLHGSYNPDSGIDDIVAGEGQYKDIVENKGAQFIQNLIGTHSIIIVGCGKTVEDVNLKGFLGFVSQYLKSDIPYFYLYKEGADTEGLPENVIPISYGDSFSDLPRFMEEITSYRIKNKLSLKELSLLQPYTDDVKLSSAYGRLHFSNKFNPFIGREREFRLLNSFCDTENKTSWWVISGEGGVGKSRLLLEWCGRLSSNWYGFFANTRIKAEKFNGFIPFADTVIILDYILGREKICAEIIENLFGVFADTPYRLRIILIERRLEKEKFTWLDKLTGEMNSSFKCVFLACKHEDPLCVVSLKREEEIKYISSYLDTYIREVADVDTKAKYSIITPELIDNIYNLFHKKFEAKYDRPLFLSIFTEVWVYKNGNIDADSIDKLLEVYLEKEEKRWEAFFGGDKELLYAYQKLLSLACAVEVICINEYNGVFQKYANLLTGFVLSNKRAGRKKLSVNELFINEEIENREIKNNETIIKDLDADEELTKNEKIAFSVAYSKISSCEEDKNTEAKIYYLLEPMYPDIIRAFITDYYLDENEWQNFTLTARNISTLEFCLFLIKAIQDFPERKSYRTMLLIAPEDSSDLLEYYIGLLATDYWHSSYKVVENVLISSEATKWYHNWEMMLWERIANVLGGENRYEELYVSFKKFLVYLNTRISIKEIRETFPEVFHSYAYYIFLDGNLQKSIAVNESIDEIASKFAEDGFIATEAAKAHATLIKIRRTEGALAQGYKDWNAVSRYRSLFPDDKDIAVYFAQVGCTWGKYLTENKREDGMRGVVAEVEEVYNQFLCEEIAEELAKLYGDECNILVSTPEMEFFDKSRENYCFRKVAELYNKFPENQLVASGYASVKSEHIFGRIYSRDKVDITECSEFRNLWLRYPEEVEFAESYAKVLAARSVYLNDKGFRGEAYKCRKEIAKLSKRANYDDYVAEDSENVIDELLRFLEDYFI